MKKLMLSFSALLLGACATTPDAPTMTAAELSECLQPNRRVIVDVVGMVAPPPAKKPEAKPEAAAEAKPEAKAEAKPEAKPPKPKLVPFQQALYVQGNSAFDPEGSALKPDGQKELEKFLATLQKRAVHVNAVILSGHTDRLEAKNGSKGLSEQRARSVKDYLVSKGLSEKAIFWEGKEAREPVPVTKFCS